ncbi:MAG: hypothetical protein GEU79_19075, partial [Acidimicrobiia bacterium]|nr:hypothetical protein [Acidimicrobiia bacterium]
EAGGQLLETAHPFDAFTGGTLGEGRKALAIRYRLRADDRTLAADEITPVRQAMIDAARTAGATPRGGE